jgi:hypothetical protein
VVATGRIWKVVIQNFDKEKKNKIWNCATEEIGDIRGICGRPKGTYYREKPQY